MNYFKLHILTISQRISNFTSNDNEALEFYNYLMRIGNGTEPTFDKYGVDMVQLPDHMVSKAMNLLMNLLIQFIFHWTLIAVTPNSSCQEQFSHH